MTIRNTGKELDILRHHHTSAVERKRRELLVESLEQFVGLFGRDISRRVVLDVVTLEADDIAAHGNLILIDGHLHGGCFERTTALEDFRHIVTEQSEVRDFRTGVIALGNGDESTVYTLASKTVEYGFIGSL